MRYPYTLAVIALCISTSANAQFQNTVYVPPYNPGLQLLNDSIRGDLDDDSDEDEQRPQTRPVAPSRTILNYTPSKAQTQRNQAKIVEQARSIDPANANKLAQFFASTDVVKQIDQMMRPMGLRADNVADAYTLWWMVAWHAANSRQGEPSRAVMAAVKRQAENALLSTPQLVNAASATKQEMAESLLIQAAMIDGHIDDAAGNPVKQAALAKAVNQGAKQMGLDLTKMTLTPDGFVPRSGGRSDAGDAAGDDSQLAANDNGSKAEGTSMGDYALYAVAGTGLLAGMFALGKGFSKKG